MLKTQFRATAWLAACASAIALPAAADVTIGVVLPLTGPTSALGLQVQNGIKLWPDEIAGEKLKVIVMDDATDPTVAIRNTRRLVTEDKVDVIVGSAATPIALAMVDVALESKTPQLAVSPPPIPPGKETWTFRLAPSSATIAQAMFDHMQRQGIKTLGFLGYTDAYGESWLQDVSKMAADHGIALSAVERFQRTDNSVTGQSLKLVAANPDAVLIVASGSGAAMPHRAMVERGYKGKLYQTHAAASRDLLRVGGKALEGAYVLSGPAVVAEQLPADFPSKQAAMDYVQQYEAKYGSGTRNQFAAHAYDIQELLKHVIPMALQSAKPGTPEFRAALRDALEAMPELPVSQGMLDYTPSDHWGFSPKSTVVLKVVNGDWQLEPKD